MAVDGEGGKCVAHCWYGSPYRVVEHNSVCSLCEFEVLNHDPFVAVDIEED